MRKIIVVLISLLALSSGAAILIARAAPPPPKAQAPGAPQVPEESATIRDDRTIAPDPKQSADNNVSFPSDI
jgi:hypothetical protein